MYPAPTAYPGGAAGNRQKAGVGYGGASGRGGREEGSGMLAAQKAQQEKDKALANLLALVRIYLPNRDRPGPFKHSDQYVYFT